MQPRGDPGGAFRLGARRVGLLAAVLAIAGVLIAGYLTAVKLAGELPACGPLKGCETVATSAYSEVAGIPVAVFGIALSAAVASLQVAFRACRFSGW